MILDATLQALRQLFSPEFRGVFLKTLGLTLLALVAIWFGMKALLEWLALPWISALLPAMPDWAGWLGVVAAVVAGIGLALLIAPVSALIAGLFLDDVAAIVERTHYPQDPPGEPVPAIRALVLSLKFVMIVIAGNLLALFLLIVPGINLVAFFIVNGYLLGREFFEFAVMRHMAEPEAKALRSDHAGTVFLGGLVIAAFMAVPLLNLLTPLFAAAMMVHLGKALDGKSGLVSGRR